MNALDIIGLICLFAALVCHFAAGILYDPPIQRYLERLGYSPAFVGFSWSGLQDYWNAKKLAKQWGHHLPFLERYGQLQVITLIFILVGTLLMALGGL